MNISELSNEELQGLLKENEELPKHFKHKGVSRELTKRQNELIKEHATKLSYRQIAELASLKGLSNYKGPLTARAISHRVNRYKLVDHNLTRCSKYLQYESFMRENYATMTRKELAFTLNLSENEIYTMSQTFNLSKAKNQRIGKDTINHDFLDTWGPEQAYFVGYMIADGSVRDPALLRDKNNGRGFSISSKDREHLVTLRNLLGSCVRVGVPTDSLTKTGHPYTAHSIHLTSSGIHANLIELGLVPRKSFVGMDFKGEMNHHLVRGFFDGDGGITAPIDKTYNPAVFMLGTEKDFIYQLHEFLINNGMKDVNVREYMPSDGKKLMYEIKWQQPHQVQKLYEILYKDCRNLYLPRKKERFETYLSSDKFKADMMKART